MKAGMFTGQRFRGMVALGEAEKPKPKDGEVLVAVEAASVNAADYRSMKKGGLHGHRPSKARR